MWVARPLKTATIWDWQVLFVIMENVRSVLMCRIASSSAFHLLIVPVTATTVYTEPVRRNSAKSSMIATIWDSKGPSVAMGNVWSAATYKPAISAAPLP